MIPTYQHDCQYCKYLGVDMPRPGEPSCTVVDLYIHDNTLIRRFSSVGDAYASTHLDILANIATSDEYKAKWTRCVALAYLDRKFWK